MQNSTVDAKINRNLEVKIMSKFIEICNSFTPWANIATIISFVITVATLILTTKIKKSINKYADKEAYKNEIESQLEYLKAARDLMVEDESRELYPKFFMELWQHLNDIPILYDNVLSSKMKKEINELTEMVGQMPPVGMYKQIVKKLSSVITKLEKIKKMS